MLSGCHHPVWHGVGSRHAGAGALKFGCKVVLFPFSVSSLPSQQWHVRPRGDQPWSKRGWCRPGLCQGGPSVPVRAQESSPSDVSVSSSSGRSLPIQMQCLVQATLSPAGCALPLAMAALTLLLELEGLERVLGVGWGMPWAGQEKLSGPLGGFSLLPPPCSQELVSMCVLFTNGVSISYRPPVSPTGFHTS